MPLVAATWSDNTWAADSATQALAGALGVEHRELSFHWLGQRLDLCRLVKAALVPPHVRTLAEVVGRVVRTCAIAHQRTQPFEWPNDQY